MPVLILVEICKTEVMEPMRNLTRCADKHAGLEINRLTMDGKPVYEIVVREVMNFARGFAEKELCDGITFSLGSACVSSCTFCYVEGMVRKHPAVVALRKELDAAGLRFQDVVIVRLNALDIIREQLTIRRPRRVRPEEARVVYPSPLVDCATNIPLAIQTVDACKVILSLTNWHICLLSKSNLLPMSLERYRDRLIFGVSTGTLNDGLAASFERGTALVSKRLESLHWLQDNGFRTFGMLCPSLPHDDYNAYAKQMAEAIRVERCEHVWAEVMNVRGHGLPETVEALRAAGYDTKQIDSPAFVIGLIGWRGRLMPGPRSWPIPSIFPPPSCGSCNVSLPRAGLVSHSPLSGVWCGSAT